MPMELFTIQHESSAGVIALRLPEEVDDTEFDQLNEAVLRTVGAKPGGRWVVDLSEVLYAGSSILGLLVNIRQQVRQGKGKLVVCAVPEHLSRIFETCSLQRLLECCGGRDEAIARVCR